MAEPDPPSDGDAEEHDGAGGPVTLSATRRVLPGKEQAYEAFLRGVTEAAARFPGHLGSRVYPPPRGSREYRVVFGFDSEANLHAWKDSEEQRRWNAIGDELAEAPPRFANISGTAQEQPLALAITPLQDFVRTTVSGVGLLLLGIALALIAANSPLAATYERFWTAELTIGTADLGITLPLRGWVNDCLMALFFFIVGLEIKREVLVGEMRSPRFAALPIAAAVGGAVAPAALFALVNRGGPGASGWGIPMATDTAFALGLITLFGSRVRPLLLVFLTAFSIVDDIIAVLVIAVFYTDAIAWRWLAVAGVLLAGLLLANRAGFHRWPVYAAGGLGVWLAVFASGVHGTAAGVLVALTVPARSWINPSEFLTRARELIADFERACFLAPTILSNEPQQHATQALEELCEEVETPMTHLQHRLNPWVAYGILPLFAFANAGIPLLSGFGEAVGSRVGWGVVAGLLVGKPLGIALFAWLAVRLGVAILPGAITWGHVVGIAFLGGVGFTISLFVTELAFAHGPEADAARIGILAGSVAAAALGYLVLRATLPPPRTEG